jgi:hypothetical protein
MMELFYRPTCLMTLTSLLPSDEGVTYDACLVPLHRISPRIYSSIFLATNLFVHFSLNLQARLAAQAASAQLLTPRYGIRPLR